MKKIVILSFLFLSFFGLLSCSQEEIKAYDDSDNIYFSPAVYPYIKKENLPIKTDSTGFSFSLENPSVDKKVFLIPIRVQGKVTNVDRKVKVTVDPSSTAVEGTNFDLPENILIRAGREVDTIAVTVYRTPDIKAKMATVVLNLEENEFFSTKMQSTVTNLLTQKTMSFIRFKLSFDDKLTEPKGWVVFYLGNFSAKKFLLMCELLNLEPSLFSVAIGSGVLTGGDYRYYGSFMKRYLQEQKASGNTIYEEDGTEMIFP